MHGTLAEHRIEVNEQLLGPRVQMTENWRHGFLGIPQIVYLVHSRSTYTAKTPEG